MKRERVFRYVHNTSIPNMTYNVRYKICEDIPFTSDYESTIKLAMKKLYVNAFTKKDCIQVKYPYITDLLYNGIETETTFVIFKLDNWDKKCINMEYCSIIDEHTVYVTDMYTTSQYCESEDIHMVLNLLKYMKVENNIGAIPELWKVYEFFKLYCINFTTDNFKLKASSHDNIVNYISRHVFKLDPKLLYTEYNKTMIKLNMINNVL